jgi:hypothetical protein
MPTISPTSLRGPRLLLVIAVGVLMALLVLAPRGAEARQSVTPIADARTLPLGTTVTVEGTVTVPSGAFASFSFDQGFAIQDGKSGIYVSIAADLGLRSRQRVRVTGTLADSFGLLVLRPSSPSDVFVRRGKRRVAPRRVATGDVGESTEGRLIRVRGSITQPVGNDLPFGYRLFVDDGSGELQVFIATTTGIDALSPAFSFLQPGQRVKVTGFSGQFEDHYELNPRSPADIEPVGGHLRALSGT